VDAVLRNRSHCQNSLLAGKVQGISSIPRPCSRKRPCQLIDLLLLFTKIPYAGEQGIFARDLIASRELDFTGRDFEPVLLTRSLGPLRGLAFSAAGAKFRPPVDEVYYPERARFALERALGFICVSGARTQWLGKPTYACRSNRQRQENRPDPSMELERGPGNRFPKSIANGPQTHRDAASATAVFDR
jgi:hypothetical protein